MPLCPHCKEKELEVSYDRYAHRGKWFCDCRVAKSALSCWFDIEENECYCGSDVKGHVPNGQYCRGI